VVRVHCVLRSAHSFLLPVLNVGFREQEDEILSLWEAVYTSSFHGMKLISTTNVVVFFFWEHN
jgi:hypothetical protein